MIMVSRSLRASIMIGAGDFSDETRPRPQRFAENDAEAGLPLIISTAHCQRTIPWRLSGLSDGYISWPKSLAFLIQQDRIVKGRPQNRPFASRKKVVPIRCGLAPDGKDQGFFALATRPRSCRFEVERGVRAPTRLPSGSFSRFVPSPFDNRPRLGVSLSPSLLFSLDRSHLCTRQFEVGGRTCA